MSDKDAITLIAINMAQIAYTMAGTEPFEIKAIVDDTLNTRWLATELDHQRRVDERRHSRLVKRLRASVQKTVTSHLGNLAVMRKGVKLRLYRPVPGQPGYWQQARAFKPAEHSATRLNYDARIARLEVPRDVQLTIEEYIARHHSQNVGEAEDELYGT